MANYTVKSVGKGENQPPETRNRKPKPQKFNTNKKKYPSLTKPQLEVNIFKKSGK